MQVFQILILETLISHKPRLMLMLMYNNQYNVLQLYQICQGN